MKRTVCGWRVAAKKRFTRVPVCFAQFYQPSSALRCYLFRGSVSVRFPKSYKGTFGYCETSNESNEFMKFPTPRRSARAGTSAAARGCLEYFCLPLEMASVTHMIVRSDRPIKPFRVQAATSLSRAIMRNTALSFLKFYEPIVDLGPFPRARSLSPSLPPPPALSPL